MAERTLSHLDAAGRAAMVDVGDKSETSREAVAEAYVALSSELLALITTGGVPKGDVFGVARIAGIQAAKRTAELIPLCHPLPLHKVDVEFGCDAGGVLITTRARTHGRTGVEMEALTAASVAALTIYDMCKAVDKGIVIERVRLREKHGGKSGSWRRDDPS